MLNIYFKNEKGNRLENIDQVRDGVWINASHLEHDDLEKLASMTDLDLLDLQDVLDLHELPRIERQEKTLLFFVRIPREQIDDKEIIHTTPLTFIVTEKYFISLALFEDKVIKDILKNSLAIATTQKAKLLIYIFLKISQRFTLRVREVNNLVASQKKKIENIKDSDINELIKYEDLLNQYISALLPVRGVFENIVAGNYFHLEEEDNDLLNDMIISIRQSAEICQVNLKSIKSLRDSYQILFTNKLNRTIQFLTAFTIIMTIPTIVASLFGMNVTLPFATHPLAFVYVLGISFIAVGIFMFVFYKKNWL
ncbi:MAG: magnesium transporter CorA family protein [Patescibacteria group bacterium]|jgi:magnesium transporter